MTDPDASKTTPTEPSDSRESPTGVGRTRLGVCSWSLRPGDPAELASAVARCGLESVQLALVPLIEEPDVWARTLETLRESGIEIASGMLATVGEDYSTLDSIRRTGGVVPDGTWPSTYALAESAARVAGTLGLDLVTFHAGFIPHDGDGRTVVLERIAALADLFGAHGARIALETGQESADTLASALAELDRDDVGVNFDPANMILYGMGDPVDAVARLASRIMQVHLKDALPTEEPGTWGTEVPLGDGAVDWRAFLDAVAGVPRTVDLIIEREAGERREHDVSLARARIAPLAARLLAGRERSEADGTDRSNEGSR